MFERHDTEWPESHLSGGKRTNLRPGSLPDWFVGYGKDESCHFEGPWHAMITLAARILASENTKLAVEHSDLPEEFYQPELDALADEWGNRTGTEYDFDDIASAVGD